MESYSLFELNEYIKRVLALNFVEPIWLRGEIAQMNESRGHLFLDLVEKSTSGEEVIARSAGVLWNKTWRKLKRNAKIPLEQILAEGNEVCVKVQVDFHERYGYKLIVADIDTEFTLGKLLVKRMQVMQRLKKENLLPKNSRLSLPIVIQRIAVISSCQAAGLQDFCQQIAQNAYGYDIRTELFEATVQGDTAAKSIVEQLKKIGTSDKNFDVVAIIRGGGARLDLAAFDEYELGKAIATCPIPVITGVGHDIDETVADHVAHTDLKTPTAVADFMIHHNLIFESTIEQQAQKIKDLGRLLLQKSKLNIGTVQQKITLQTSQKWQLAERDLSLITQSLSSKIHHYLLRKQHALEEKQQQLNAFDIESVWNKGYALVTQNGQKVSSIDGLQIDDKLNVVFKDGLLSVSVDNIKNK